MEFHHILNNFPTFELSYDMILHKKIHEVDIYLAIPFGQKSFVWFTSHNEQNVCFVLDISDNNSICNIYIAFTGFSNNLVMGKYGTILYGTIIKHNNNKCFCIEDIYYYEGLKCGYKFADKLDILNKMFNSELSNVVLNDHFLILGLPLINSNYDKLLNDIKLLPYIIDKIVFKYLNNPKTYSIKYLANNCRIIDNTTNRQTNQQTNYQTNHQTNQQTNHQTNQQTNHQTNHQTNQQTNHQTNQQINQQTNCQTNQQTNRQTNQSKTIFKVTPDVQNDIYILSTLNADGTYSFYDFANIPNYSTSVMMNKLFRNIKENANLDLLEESDDELEFENNNNNKFVFLEKSYNMICAFNRKFKSWTPLSISQNKYDNVILTKKLIKLL